MGSRASRAHLGGRGRAGARRYLRDPATVGFMISGPDRDKWRYVRVRASAPIDGMMQGLVQRELDPERRCGCKRWCVSRSVATRTHGRHGVSSREPRACRGTGTRPRAFLPAHGRSPGRARRSTWHGGAASSDAALCPVRGPCAPSRSRRRERDDGRTCTPPRTRCEASSPAVRRRHARGCAARPTRRSACAPPGGSGRA